ncbi:amino acid adenylation domain-containing protein [Streptomyces sp. 5K101]|uniref:amino acid adenylation domain-containing protein n=1 Tax=Streptomyces sp. 5K101 TaxID=3390037 RepID=UPI0039770945
MTEPSRPLSGATGSPLVHEAVSRHATATPAATALVHRGRRIDFRTLDSAAGSYAAALDAHGVRRGHIVPLLLPRSPELVAVQLAVLKRGAAYASLDPRWPAPRLRDVLGTLGGPPVLVTDGAASPDGTTPVLRTPPADLLRAAALPERAAPPERPVPSDPAAVIFTSGTTGRPKGVVLPHRAVTRMFRAVPPAGFGKGHVMPQAAPPWWDMYAYELFGQLMTGGTSVLTDGDHLLPQTVRGLIEDEGLTTLRLTTTLFHLFVDEDPGSFTGLRHVYVGGERMSPRHARAFLTRHPGVTLVNGYGPAESCMHAASHRVLTEDCDREDGIPLGTEVPFTSVAVLDPEGRPCAPGDLGEIHISGEGLALGYLGEPELTARAFVTVDIDGERVRAYRTGDFGYRDETGTLHFRGRTDRQLKIRGHRVEAAEIETAAASVAGVGRSVVVPMSAPDGSVTGTALFYTLAGADARREDAESSETDPLALHDQLTALLPEFLVPAVTCAVEDFPLMPNGKLDRAALGGLAIRQRRRRRPRAAASADRRPAPERSEP